MAYTEFYCDAASGDNRNSGSTEGTYSFQDTGGDWDGSGTFTSNTSADLSGISVGDWASVYVDGATTTARIARITAVDNTAKTITLIIGTTQGAAGSAPASQTGTCTIRVGGAWVGPGGGASSDDHVPFRLGYLHRLTNANNEPPCINLKNGTSYTPANTVSIGAGSYSFRVSGYTTTVRDGGEAVIDFGTSNTSTHFDMGNVNGGATFTDLHITADHSAVVSGNYTGFVAYFCNCRRVRVSGFYYLGVYANHSTFEECEFYDSGKPSGNTGNLILTGSCTFRRCKFGETMGSTYCLVASTSNYEHTFIDSIFYGDGTLVAAVYNSSTAMMRFENVDFYGFDNAIQNYNYSVYTLVNCNIVSCDYVLRQVGTNTHLTIIELINCGFGGGAYALTGTVNAFPSPDPTHYEEIDCKTYATHPWVDPDTGDFRLSDEAAGPGQGRGEFLVTDPGNSYNLSTNEHIGSAVQAITASGNIIIIED